MLQRIDLSSDDVQIIHVHGSYWFYDCCNLKREISDRAEMQRDTSFTMLSLLDNLLWVHSPLVVGYSGWEGDVFMNALQRRLTTGLGTKLYWFCYRKRDAEALPEWLTTNSNVCIVLPELAETTERLESPAGLANPGGLLPGSAQPREEATLEATAVFDRLIDKFNLGVPELTKQPLRFFTDQLKRSFRGDKDDEKATDVYAIHSVIARLEKAAKADELPERSRAESLLEVFRDAVRQSKYREAIRIAGVVPLSELSPEQLMELITSLENARSALQDDSDEELAACDLIVAACDALAAEQDKSLGLHIAEALYRKGGVLLRANRNEESLAVSDEVLLRFGETDDPAETRFVARSLGNKIVALWNLGRTNDADVSFRSLVNRFGFSADEDIGVQVARAFFNKGVTLQELAEDEQALAAYDEPLRRILEHSGAEARRFAAVTLANKAVALSTMERDDQALAVCEEVLKRFGGSQDPDIRWSLAIGLARKGVVYSRLKRAQQAITAYDELLQRFEEAPEPYIRNLIEDARSNRQAALEQLKTEQES